MLTIRKAYTLLVRGKSRGVLEDFEPVFPDLPSFFPEELSTSEACEPPAPFEKLPEQAPADPQYKVHPTDLIGSFFALLLGEAPDAKQIWRAFHVAFHGNCEAFSAALGRNMEGEDLINLLALFLIQVARNGVFAPEHCARMFHVAEGLGVHLLPVHFYTPIPHTASLEESVWSHRFGRDGAWSLNEQGQLDLLEELSRFSPELEGIPMEEGAHAICQTDAAVYYSMIRRFRPALIIEVGAGYSTLIASAACVRNGDTVLEAIDPYPPPHVTNSAPGLIGLVTEAVQKIPLATFQALGENDILFIDSSHICKIASDVNYLILSVLPSLNKGVLIHFHDVFLPWNYPRSWVLEKNLFWNEQYLLLAFLMFNDQFEILLASHYLGREHATSLLSAFPFLKDPGGCSVWLRRK